ncbi:amino acid racemase [Halobacillus sp. ACCC02827]|uniref:aspartate/glutamate racemase family protein n=1 Tax=Bacillaceae TaxID=186817 RepID=UPI0002A511AF|nr:MULTISPECIES: amino acid racemase [Bacillaceae]ELK48225.1 aspartate racemase [Halobacillus sp. BAB-2008]QHT48400.1 aspartate/glutamate racemase family protein [Bacillus sp. SB49]WJE15633.1 amino acid racemase [Halobacillus sp. ACCC02827]
MNDKLIGILGGMGPEATAECYLKIIRATDASKDQEHYRVIIDSNAKIPDRTEAISGRGASPVPEMTHAAKNLEKLGVEVAVIPCMTAHYFIEEVQKSVSFPLLNAFLELKKFIQDHYPKVTKIGVLATTGTLESGLFQKYFDHLEVVTPTPLTQKNKVMDAIYGENGIKSGNTDHDPLDKLKEASMELLNNGAELIISGCTEIGLVLKPYHLSVPLIDPMEVVANVVVKESVYQKS